MLHLHKILITILLFISIDACSQSNQFDGYQEGWVDNSGVKLHYMTKGEGQLIIFLHGFPDFWYTWKGVMDELGDEYKAVALDLRGYNKSDNPEGVDQYKMSVLFTDIDAVIDHFSSTKAILVGNDWGGAIAWQFAMYYPHRVKGLVACNIPHPSSLAQYLQRNPSSSNYVEKFTAEGAEDNFTPESLARIAIIKEEEMPLYTEAMKNSDFAAMFNYYRANYPKKGKISKRSSPIRIKCPVLVIHGLEDSVFPPSSINSTWEWIDNKVTVHTLHEVGHFVQRESPAEVASFLDIWLQHTFR